MRYRIEEMMTLKLMQSVRSLESKDRFIFIKKTIKDWGLEVYSLTDELLEASAEKMWSMVKDLDTKLVEQKSMVIKIK